MGKLDVLKKDFEDALSRIDFSKPYNAMSPNFLQALSAGLMHMAVKEVCVDDVTEELDGAEKYFLMYEQTGDASYKDMASDELKHAGILIKKHLAKSTDAEHKEWLGEQEKKRLDMVRMVSTATVPVKVE